MNTRILDEAASEFADAIARYESIESGLGVRLKQEVKSALAWISAHPELPRVRPVLRRILCPEDWQGHPLRKDYPLGYEEVQFTFNFDEIDAKKPHATRD